jgi:hypothetical protein
MSTNSFIAKLLRFIGVILMALTAAFTLFGGIGTSCVALNPTGFSESLAKLASFQWLYILFVLSGIALGVFGILATIHLVKGTGKAYREALYVLVAGVVIGVIHMVVSRSLRGSSMPVDAVVYTTILTLVLFLIFRIPYIWQGVDFTKRKDGSTRLAGGAAAILVGLLALTIQFTMGPTHTWQGTNYADAFNLLMAGIGLSSLALGIGLMFGRHNSREHAIQAGLETAEGQSQ